MLPVTADDPVKNKTKEKSKGLLLFAKKNMKNKTTAFLTQAALIAALYVVLTYIASALGISSGVIQVRFSEALCILPIFTMAAVPGLYLGCLLANLLTGAVIWDVIFGSLVTLAAAFCTRFLRKKPFFATFPPVILNALIIPIILIYAYEVPDAYWYLVLTVGAGELISCTILGWLFYKALDRYKGSLFRKSNN